MDSDPVGGDERYGILSHLSGIGASGVFRKISLKISIGILDRIIWIDRIEQERMAKLKFKWVPNACYYPDGNGIELIFAMVKREYNKLRLN